MSIFKKYPRFRLGYLIFSLFLIAAAIYVGFSIWGSIIAGLAIWLLASASYPGLEFSPDCRYMRNYYGLFNYKIGSWERLPTIIGVTIKQFSELVKSDSKYNAGIWDTSPKRYTEAVVMLTVKDSLTGIIIARFSEDEIAQALAFASNTAKKFNVPLSNFLSPTLLKTL